MRLYSLTGALAVDAPEGHFEPADDGGFALPGTLSDRLHSSHVRGRKQWETEIERGERLHGEEAARRRDPETLYNAVAEIANVTRQLARLRLDDAQPGEEQAAPGPARRRKPAAPKTDGDTE